MSKASIGQHMDHHYRRIATARGRIDTATPKSMIYGIKSKARSKYNAKKTCAIKGMKSTAEIKPTGGRGGEGLDPILDYRLGTSPHPKWLLYHSSTGQSMAITKATRPNAAPPTQKKLLPWKPAYKASDDKPSHNCLKDTTNSTYTNTQQIPKEDVIEEIIQPRQIARWQEIAESNNIIKAKIEDNQLEYVYWDFLSVIIRHILNEGVYTNTSLESLFQHHVNNNKHTLREDLMWKKIDWLKYKLSM